MGDSKQKIVTDQLLENSNKTDSKLHNESDLAKRSRIGERQKTKLFLLLCVFGVVLGILFEMRNSRNQRHKNESTKKYWVYSAHNDVHSNTGLLKHVHLVLERVGYEKSTNTTSNWSLLWSHDYPFRVLYPNLHSLKPNQRVNHFPGTGFITNKVDLATSQSKYIPKAYKLPRNKEEFLKFAKNNQNVLFLEKNNQHRGVFLKNISEIDLSSGDSFVQEYIQKPFLVDGHKFDIGVYVVLTSVNPLRAYWYKGDVLFRYCPSKYYPFDPKDLDKYVIGDDYLPTWEVPSLARPYTALGYSMKDSFDVYVKSQNKDPSTMWSEVQNAIAEVFINKEHHIIEALKGYPSGDNFFELMRFDLVVDEDLKVYLLEANMSPNLSSAHYPPNQLLYEQVLYSLFSLTGVSSLLRDREVDAKEDASASRNMITSQKNIAVWGEECNTICRDDCESSAVCGLCRPCLTVKLKNSLMRAHYEYLHRGDFRRLYPPTMKPGTTDHSNSINISMNNKLQHLWYQGKCNEDITWCS